MNAQEKIQKTLQLVDLARTAGSPDEIVDCRHELAQMAQIDLSGALSAFYESANSLMKSYELRRPGERDDSILQSTLYGLKKQGKMLANSGNDEVV